jgi:hypothetical protein
MHGLGDALLIRRNDLSQILRVHAGGERGRADEIDEHHSHLASLGIMPLVWLRRGCGRGRGAGAGTVVNRAQHLPAMPEQDPDILEVLICQIRENGDIDAVFSKAARILGQSERGQPLRDRNHRISP